MCCRIYQLSWFILLFVTLVGLTALPSVRLVAQSFNLPLPEVITAKEGLPQGFVPAIVQDQQGFIWMATRDGLCRYDGHQFKVFQPTTGSQTSLSSPGLVNIQLDEQQRIWITSDQSDIDLFDPIRETFLNFSKQAFYQRSFRGLFLRHIYPDRNNRLWLIFDGGGLACINLPTHRVHWYRHQPANPHSLSSDLVRVVTQDRTGSIWVVTDKGLDQFTAATGFTHFPSSQKGVGPDSLPTQNIYAATESTRGQLILLSIKYLTLFNPASGYCRNYPLPSATQEVFTQAMSTDSRGNVYFNRHNRLFRFNETQGVQQLPPVADVIEYKSLFIDRSDVLWTGTDGQGVRKFNLRAGLFQTRPYQTSFCIDLLTHFLDIPRSQLSVLPADLFAYNFRYTFDRAGKFWFNAGQTPFYQVDLQTKTLTSVPFPVPIASINMPDRPICLATDPDGRIWAVCDTIVKWYEKGQWHPFPHRLRPRVESAILQVVVDKQALWLATGSRGLYRVDRVSGQVRQYGYRSGNRSSLNSNNLYCLFADPFEDNLLWVGTFGNGLCRFDKRTGLSRYLTKQNGLPNNVVYAAIPDRRGAVWVATNQGLCRVDRATFQTRTYTREDGLLADEFNRFHSLHLPDDRIFLGGLEGVTAFDPAHPQPDTYQPVVQTTNILINNQSLVPGKITTGLPIGLVNQLDLTHQQNFVTVQFAAMQYNRRNKIRYRHQLEGLDKTWIETERPEAAYTDLRPGSYVLRLNVSNTSGVWSKYIRTLRIVIHPPFWATWWAYLLYLLTVTGVGYGLLRLYLNRLHLQQSIAFAQKEIELKQKETQQLREVDELKTRFFSNITHEFRTPLTLIMSPAEQMMQEPRASKDIRRLTSIDRNAQQLLGLINQLLDLSKLESGAMTINALQGNVAEFIDQLVQSFQSAAETKRITLSFQHQLTNPAYWFDADKLERILLNLVSNALKFTPADGNILVRLESEAQEGVYITVSDTGIGIPADKQAFIFDRFYQIDDSSTRREEGTGIGLALVKEFVQLQGGIIELTAPSAGYTTTFTLHLPYRPAIFIVPSSSGSRELANGFAASGDEADEPSVILLVEDNAELADFIAESLPPSYRLLRASNGAEGLAQAEEVTPDLVISDVLMPVMDGYTLCQKLKTNLQTSHIPVILLTAKAAHASRIEGLQLGADDYLTKPFHVAELRLRVRNLLQRQQRLREWLRADLTQPGSSRSDRIAEFSDPCLTQLYRILESRLDDSAFGVNELIREIGMSSSSLHRKLRALSGLSAVELIRNYRLKRAAHFLKEGKTVSEAATLVGFNNLSYFAKCFRDFYHLAPREFVDQD